MELVSIANSQLLSLSAAVRDAGTVPVATAINAISAQYKFQTFPKAFQDLDKNAIEFGFGEFMGTSIESFGVYNDGLIIKSSCPTGILDDFEDHFKGWMKKEFEIRFVQQHSVSRIYESEVIVRTDADIFAPLSELQEFCSEISSALRKQSKLDVPFGRYGFILAPDPTEIAGLKPIPFRIERQAGINFDQNFFYASAPLPTDEHLRLLKKLVKLAG